MYRQVAVHRWTDRYRLGRISHMQNGRPYFAPRTQKKCFACLPNQLGHRCEGQRPGVIEFRIGVAELKTIASDAVQTAAVLLEQACADEAYAIAVNLTWRHA